MQYTVNVMEDCLFGDRTALLVPIWLVVLSELVESPIGYVVDGVTIVAKSIPTNT